MAGAGGPPLIVRSSLILARDGMASTTRTAFSRCCCRSGLSLWRWGSCDEPSAPRTRPGVIADSQAGDAAPTAQPPQTEPEPPRLRPPVRVAGGDPGSPASAGANGHRLTTAAPRQGAWAGLRSTSETKDLIKSSVAGTRNVHGGEKWRPRLRYAQQASRPRVVRQRLDQFPAMALLAPRQLGKTILALQGAP